MGDCTNPLSSSTNNIDRLEQLKNNNSKAF